MKVSEIIKKLRLQGWKLTEHGARHDRWENEFYEGFVLVPRHKSRELSKVVEKDIKSAMREAEWNKLRKKL